MTKQEPKLRGKHFPWVRIVIVIVGLLFIGAGVAFSFFYTSQGSIVLTGLGLLIAFLAWIVPFNSDTVQKPITTTTLQSQTTPATTNNAIVSFHDEENRTIWNVPYPHYPLFTGREDVLRQLHDNLSSSKMAVLTQPQAISGLGGIGKTQTAVEYAYRYHNEYQYVFWVRAESEEILLTDLAGLAKENFLNLPQKEEKDQHIVVNAVIRWFNMHTRWLLILDNVEDISMIQTSLLQRSSLAFQLGNGHILLTTRSQATGAYIRAIDVKKLNADDGAHFLLLRAKKNTVSEAEYALAKNISELVDGLPLALDQAGAYIEETSCSLYHYLGLYQNQKARAILLNRRGNDVINHPESVTTTFKLSFTKIQQTNPIAADVLCLCVFLYPDNIPEAIIFNGAPKFIPTLQSETDYSHLLDEALAALQTYSILRRNLDHQTFHIHRIIQAVLQETMNVDEQHQWAERAVRTVNSNFPEIKDSTRIELQWYLPQALTCASLIESWNIFILDAIQLLTKTGNYLYYLDQYKEAEPLLRQALTISEQVLGENHVITVHCLYDLGNLYYDEGKYQEAEPILRQALKISEQVLGENHHITIDSMNDLGKLYRDQGKYEQAELLIKKALSICESEVDPKALVLTGLLNSLAENYRIQGKDKQAASLYLRALTLAKKEYGQNYLGPLYILGNLALIYKDQGKYNKAKSLQKRILAIEEKTSDPDSPHIAATLHNLALVLLAQHKYKQAWKLSNRSLEICTRVLEPGHHYMANCFDLQARLYIAHGKYEQAEPLRRQALAIKEKIFGSDVPELVYYLNSLARLYWLQGRYEEAVPLFQRVILIKEKVFGPDRSELVAYLNSLVSLYWLQGRYEEAVPLFQRIILIKEKVFGTDYPGIVGYLNSLARLYWLQGRYEEAETLYLRAIGIIKLGLGNIRLYKMYARVLKNYVSFRRTLKNRRKDELTPATESKLLQDESKD